MAALVTALLLLDLLVAGGATGLFRALMGAGFAARGGIAGQAPNFRTVGPPCEPLDRSSLAAHDRLQSSLDIRCGEL